jgi:hypothetical protein
LRFLTLVALFDRLPLVPRVRRLLLDRFVLPVLLVGLLAAGCQVQTKVTVHMDDDGSGAVEVAVGLDEEALGQLPDLDRSGVGDAADLTHLVRADDLTATGWRLSEPKAEDDLTWIRATKPFGTPAEAAQILGELTGPDTGLHDLRFERSRGFGSTSYSFAGTADMSGGLEALGDSGLAAALDGEPLGEDTAQIEQRLGKPISEMVKLDIAVELPGATKTWSPVVGGDAVAMSTESTVYDKPVWLLTALAVVCLVALAAVLLVRWRRAA